MNNFSSDYPGVWAQISSEYDWIVDTMCQLHSNPKPSLCEGYTESPTLSSVPTLNPSKSLEPTTSPTTFECNGDQMEVYLQLTTDNYGFETSWTLKENSTLAILESDTSLISNYDYNYKFCLPCSSYIFEIEDNFGDGIVLPGGFTLYVDNSIIGESGSTDFFSKSINIYEGNHCPVKEQCENDEITFDLTHYGDYPGIRWTIEDAMTGDLIHDRTDLKVMELNQVRLCLSCSRYIFRVWNQLSGPVTGALSIAVSEELFQRYNLLTDLVDLSLSSNKFTGGSCSPYYRFVSNLKHNEIDYCIEAKNIRKNALILVRKCDEYETKQLWEPDEFGQLHAFQDTSLCMAKQKNMMKLKPCAGGYMKSRAKSIAYSQFTKQLIWMNDAKKSLSVSSDLALSNEVSMKTFDQNSVRQQWRVEEL